MRGLSLLTAGTIFIVERYGAKQTVPVFGNFLKFVGLVLMTLHRSWQVSGRPGATKLRLLFWGVAQWAQVTMLHRETKGRVAWSQNISIHLRLVTILVAQLGTRQRPQERA